MLSGQFLFRPYWAFEALRGGGSRCSRDNAGSDAADGIGAAKGAPAALLGVRSRGRRELARFQRRLNYLLDPTYPVLALVAVHAVHTVAVFDREERQRRYSTRPSTASSPRNGPPIAADRASSSSAAKSAT